MKSTCFALLSVLVLLSPQICAQDKAEQHEQIDILGRILAEVGFSRSDLGYQPRGYWNRFPLDIPYRLTSFDDLFAEPLKLYDYATVMGNVVETYLNPNYADTADNSLHKLVYHLGVDKKLGGFRDYSANLQTISGDNEPLVAAFERLYIMADKQTAAYTFGAKSEGLDVAAEVRSKSEGLPDSARTIIAQLLVNLADAIHWRTLAFRRCDSDAMQAVFAIRDLAQTQGDGQVYYPEIDDIAATIDWPSLHYAALKTAAAAEQAERALQPFVKDIPDDFSFEMETPFGKVAIFSPTYITTHRPPPRFFSSLVASNQGYFEYDATNSLAIIDFGRRSIWQGTPGATASLSNPVSVLIDMGGNDYYGDPETNQPPSCGAGLLGVGVLLDSDGNDHYYGTNYTQGAGFFGVGVLLDRKGKDKYRAAESAQGAGYFGIGLCLDGSGDDEFYLYGDGQGMGGVGGGIGVLASFSGDDKYTAEPYSKVFNRGDYHSKQVINVSNAQGAGMGRRGDGSDGHSWAGGLGAIIDIKGHDEYLSGNFSLGIGYWFGTGIVYDRNGNDNFRSCYFTQGSGAHFCNGVLIDENGDDNHELFETAGAAFGFGWDYTNALLINKNGNDTYSAKMISYGLAQIRSNAFFIDIGGDDVYEFTKGGAGFGEATFRNDFASPSRLTPYYSYAKSFGAFIEIGGNDSYYQTEGDKRTLHPNTLTNNLWLRPSREDPNFGANNFGVGIDTESGTIPEFFKWDD